MRTGRSDDPKPRNICLACHFHLCNWVFPLLSIRVFFSSFCPSVSPFAERSVSVWMADHKGGPGVTGTGVMCRGRFVRDHGTPLENPTVTLTGEGGLFLPDRDNTSGHMEVEVLFSLLVSRTAWVLHDDIFKDKARVFPTSTSSHEVYSQWCNYGGLLLATAKPPSPVSMVKEGLKESLLGEQCLQKMTSCLPWIWPCTFSPALAPALNTRGHEAPGSRQACLPELGEACWNSAWM